VLNQIQPFPFFHLSNYNSTQSILGGQLLKLPTLAINFRFPWGYMNLYFEVPPKLAPYMSDDKHQSNKKAMDPSLTISEQTLAKWLLGDTHYKNERLKLIPYVAEGPWVVRNMVTGRPAIIGKKLPVSYQFWPESPEKGHKPLLIATLDIGNSSATAKRIVSVCRRYMSALTVDIGFVIQGESAAELPEQMLGAMRIHGPDPLKAPKLN
jgi:Protein ENHANCED DISEASE RESISTANCE 2, C-terminal